MIKTLSNMMRLNIDHTSVFIDEKLNQPIRNTHDLYQGVDIIIVRLCYTKHTSHIHGRTLCGLAVSTMR